MKLRATIIALSFLLAGGATANAETNKELKLFAFIPLEKTSSLDPFIYGKKDNPVTDMYKSLLIESGDDRRLALLKGETGVDYSKQLKNNYILHTPGQAKAKFYTNIEPNEAWIVIEKIPEAKNPNPFEAKRAVSLFLIPKVERKYYIITKLEPVSDSQRVDDR